MDIVKMAFIKRNKRKKARRNIHVILKDYMLY